MKKNNSVAMTSKLLAGLSIVAGIGTLPIYAVDVNNSAVDVNVKDVNASVYEKDGHYYAKLVADKEVSNVNVRIVTENKAEFTIKRDLIKAGEVVEVELDFDAALAKKKLPQTSVVKTKSFTTSSQAGAHTFKISVTYNVLENEDAATKVETNVKAGSTLEDILKENGKEAANEKAAETPQAPKTEVKPTESEKPTETAKPAERTEQPGKVDKDTTSTTSLKDILNSEAEEVKAEAPATSEKPKEAAKPAEVATPAKKAEQPGKVDKDTTPTTSLKDVLNSGAEEVKAEAPATGVALRSASASATNKVLPTATNTAAKAAATPSATDREEAIKNAYIAKVNELRASNGLSTLAVNEKLNTATKNRANTVADTGVTAAVHGAGGSLEKNAAAAAGYEKSGNILYNVVAGSNAGTPDQVASNLLNALFYEKGNVTTAYPYGHRNTLLASSATELGVGVKVKNGLATLVHHQDNTGNFQGTKAIPAKGPNA